MATGIGAKSYVQIGKESTYGTSVAATRKFEVVSFNMDPVVGFILDNSLYSAPSRRGLYQGGLFYRGKMSVRLNYEGYEKLFEGVFGLKTTTGAGPYTHTFKELADLPSYTIEMIEGDIPANQCQKAVGVIFTGVTIRGTAGQGSDAMLQAEFDMIAKDKTTAATPTGALSYPTIYPVLYHQATTVDNGQSAAAGIRVRSFEVSIQNPMMEDRFYLGSVNPDAPLRSDFLTAKWKFVEEFQDVSLFTAAKSFTGGTPQLIFTNSTRVLELRSAKTQWSEYGNPVEGYGIILATHVQEAYYDSGDASAIVAVITNSLATV